MPYNSRELLEAALSALNQIQNHHLYHETYVSTYQLAADIEYHLKSVDAGGHAP